MGRWDGRNSGGGASGTAKHRRAKDKTGQDIADHWKAFSSGYSFYCNSFGNGIDNGYCF